MPTPSKPIRVMIVDDHAVVRSGLAAFLLAQDDLELVGEARNGQEALSLCQQCDPDVILMDLIMPEMDGPTTTRLIRSRFPRTVIIALTSFHDEDLVQQALRAGATSYLLKHISAQELTAAIRNAYAGRPTLAPEAVQVLIAATTQLPKPGFDLTAREIEVLKYLVTGRTNPEIAHRLSISSSTVKYHVSSILSKLGVASRTEAVSVALQNDLIDWAGS